MSFSPARTATLIGAPTDVGASVRGSSMGPEAMRVAGLQTALANRGFRATRPSTALIVESAVTS